MKPSKNHCSICFNRYHQSLFFFQNLLYILKQAKHFNHFIQYNYDCLQFSCRKENNFNINLADMYHSVKTGVNKNRSKSKTPTKNDKNSAYISNTSPRRKKESVKVDQVVQDKDTKISAVIRSKTKQSYNILQNLQQIYSELTFGKFEIFPIVMIENAKKNIEDLMLYLGHQPICRYHKDLLNLYCDNDKTVICVSCVYKGPEHKSHRIKSIQSVEKIIQLQTIRCEQKTKNLIHQLANLKDEIDYMTRQVGQNYMAISNYTISIVDEAVRELNALKSEMQKKLSLAYRRTTTVINRYHESLEFMITRLEKGIQQSMVMSPLSRYLLLKELTMENDLIESLINKYSQNKEMMSQWQKSNTDFEKVVLKMRAIITKKIDSFVVTQF